MIFYIYLVVQDLAFRCVQDIGCTSISTQHFTALLVGGAMEIMFEAPLVIRIFRARREE